MSAVQVAVEGAVMTVTISRPEARNAVSSAIASDLFNAFGRFEQDESLAVAILTGQGGNFCAGFDLEELAVGGGDFLRYTERGPMGPTRMQLGKPVIAVIEGYAVAGGLSLRCGATCAWRPATPSSECSTGGSGCR